MVERFEVEFRLVDGLASLYWRGRFFGLHFCDRRRGFDGNFCRRGNYRRGRFFGLTVDKLVFHVDLSV